MVVVFGVLVLDDDLIAQEAGWLGGCVSNQGLFLGQFELEAVAQKLLEVLLDDLCVLFGASQPQTEIIGVADVP